MDSRDFLIHTTALGSSVLVPVAVVVSTRALLDSCHNSPAAGADFEAEDLLLAANCCDWHSCSFAPADAMAGIGSVFVEEGGAAMAGAASSDLAEAAVVDLVFSARQVLAV